jgi:glycosyltransferase involved in cell wall biosynthesis
MDHMRFLGPINHNKLPSLFNAADVFLMPTLLSEVLPYAALEAMACGLPIIATDIGGTRELVDGAGFLVPPKNVDQLAHAMEDLARDPEQRHQLSERSRNRAKTFFSEVQAAHALKDLLTRITSPS